MRKIFLGIFIGIILSVCWYSGRQVIYKYLFTIPAVSPLSKLGEKPLEKYSVLRLSGRTYPGSQIVLDSVTATASAYSVNTFHFESDGKKVSGVAHIPNDASSINKKPVIVQFRGYADRETYFPGEGTNPSAEVYAANGFITLAPDFLGYGGSDAPSPDAFEDRFLTYTTALNLLASVKTIPMADASKIGIWGHSNGGQIALTVLEILGRPVPAVLWAPVSKPFPYSILYYTDDIPDHGKLLRKSVATFESEYDPEQYSLTNYLSRITGPLQIHQGSADAAVPLSWSDTLSESLKASSSSILSYFVYPGADHNMRPVGWNAVVARDITFFRNYLR